ncbi:hypothetical protein [Waddlia chondrophila]|uniref:Polymer-forming cytoskeletal protein n=2 Tax=Waddlia chondrophila TaxID=71667 RepID=D6YTY6_WADCW|nr:hypothetical protein [Waddlia chondrophila]ADI37597.1 hypothetical protein wcw_0222 [Waddlia chondrophila WSU 86-1044]
MQTPYQYSQVFENEELDSISVDGSVFINRTTVSNSVLVNGSLLAKESNLGSLHVNGAAKVENSLINNETIINGAIYAKSTSFEGFFSVASEKTTLKDCEAHLLEVRKINNNKTQQILELLGNTTIHGDIKFESQEGLIYVTKGVKILGEVIGGTVQFR